MISDNPLIIDAVVFDDPDYRKRLNYEAAEDLNKALYFAFVLGRQEWIAELIKAGVSLNEMNNGVAPFFGAAFGNCPKSLKIAIKLHADFSVKTESGLAFFQVAILSNSSQVLLTYIDHVISNKTELTSIQKAEEKYDKLDWFLEIKSKSSKWHNVD